MKNQKLNHTEEEKLLTELTNPNYPYANVALPKDATPLERSKYSLCKKILAYEQDNGLSTEKLAQLINLTLPETEDILFARINKFTLDRLIFYASNLFSPFELGIIKAEPRERNISAL